MPVISRLVERRLDDEFYGSYAIVDGLDGRSHHITLPDLDAVGDSASSSILELRTFDDMHGKRRIALAVRSDLDLAHQVSAAGTT
ncbi:hypothetical protein [Ancylobacter novellus]|uniref:hypothetical protein n=1 Tax=Ancylobacter novellus TaxID=921 RepID=UPI00030BE19A